MERKSAQRLARIACQVLGVLILAGLGGVGAVSAQIFTQQDALMARMNRARALAAANDLTGAVKELEAIRSSTKDDATRDVTAIMLMGLYFEQANYSGAQALLEEAFKARAKNAGAYFATSGQSLRGVRGRLERYRLYSLNVSAPDLPDEAIADLDKMRFLLERMADQSKAITAENPKSFEASALLEEVAALRASLARDDKDRNRWTGELASVRQHMVESETRMKTSDMVLTSAPAPDTSATNINPPRPANGTPSRPAGRATPTPAPKSAGGEMLPVTVPRNVETTPNNTTELARNNDTPPANNTRSGNNADSSAPKSTPNSPLTQPGKPVETAKATPQPTPVPAPANTTAAPRTPPNGLVEVGALAYKATQKRTPAYPVIAKNARVTGTVKVTLELDESGSIARVKSVEGPVLLQRAAEDAARGWKFSQTIIDGQPVRVTGFLVFNFTL